MVLEGFWALLGRFLGVLSKFCKGLQNFTKPSLCQDPRAASLRHAKHHNARGSSPQREGPCTKVLKLEFPSLNDQPAGVRGDRQEK